MTDIQTGMSLADIKVETNAVPAVTEQQSVNEAPVVPITEPVAPIAEPTEPVEPVIAPSPTPEQKDNDLARERIKEQMRADSLQKQLDAQKPVNKVPDNEPDINDQSTWGDKYKDSPNDLKTYLTAYREWAEAGAEKKVHESIAQQNYCQQQDKIRVEVAAREQEARAKYSDYDTVISPIVPVIASVPILKDFAATPMGPQVIYELAKNPAVLDRIMRSDTWSAGEQLLNIAARLKAPKPADITNAPEPIKPVGSRETVKPRIVEMASKDIGGYFETMNKRELAARH